MKVHPKFYAAHMHLQMRLTEWLGVVNGRQEDEDWARGAGHKGNKEEPTRITFWLLTNRTAAFFVPSIILIPPPSQSLIERHNNKKNKGHSSSPEWLWAPLLWARTATDNDQLLAFFHNWYWPGAAVARPSSSVESVQWTPHKKSKKC